MSALGLVVRHRDRLLSVIVHIDPEGFLEPHSAQPGGLLAIALESDATKLAPIFGAHAHEVVGRFDRFSECEEACERYATSWIERQKALPPCDCGTIETESPGRVGPPDCSATPADTGARVKGAQGDETGALGRRRSKSVRFRKGQNE